MSVGIWFTENFSALLSRKLQSINRPNSFYLGWLNWSVLAPGGVASDRSDTPPPPATGLRLHKGLGLGAFEGPGLGLEGCSLGLGLNILVLTT